MTAPNPAWLIAPPRSLDNWSQYHTLLTITSLCYYADMAKTRTTLTIDEEVLRAVKVRAARSGKGESEVIEEAVRKDLGLDLMERLWARNQLTEEEAMQLAVEEQEAFRKETKR
jgi:hypothetical protein